MMNELGAVGLRHVDFAGKTDDKLREEARAHLARSPQLQVVAEILGRLRTLALPWWSAERLRSAFPIATRVQWFVERPDLRQALTYRLTGFAPRAARARTPASQAELIDAVLDSGDVDCATVEAAFDPRDVAVYGPVGAYWKKFRESMPWDSDTRPHQQLVAWMLRTMTADRSEDGTPRKPVLSAWDVRTSIDTKTWQTRIPLEVRVAIDEARLQSEKKNPREPFLARHEFETATPDIIAAHVPLRELQRVFIHAEKALGFAEVETEKSGLSPRVRTHPALDAQATPFTGEIMIDDCFESLEASAT
jgi:hypothetical protein